MFDFLDFMDSDWFVISLEIAFLIFIIFDVKKYFQTHDKKKKQSYMINVLLTLGFFIWTAIPFYNKYYTWQDKEKAMMMDECIKDLNVTHCECLEDKIFKEYPYSQYKELATINASSLQEFQDEAKKECIEN